MYKHAPFWLVIAALANAGILGSATTPFTFVNPPGPHGVGLRVVLQYDYSRTYRGAVDAAGRPYLGERARPVETLIWYPAQGTGKALKIGDYLALFATEENFSPTPEEAAAAVGLAEKTFDADPASPMRAVKDAKPEQGRWPVVIYAPSFSAPAFENADMCEYLASEGYVVIASPDMGAHGRSMTTDLEGIEAQAQDISFLIGYARTLPEADVSAVAVAGFSWGGISNLFAAAKDSRIKALLFFDGSARYFPQLVADSKYVRPGEMSLPLIFFTQKEITLEDVTRTKRDVSRNVLNDLTHCDRIIVRMHGMAHGNFASLFQRSPHIWNSAPAGEYSAREVRESYGWVSRYAAAFLDAKLKHDAAAEKFLANSPDENGVPAHMLGLEVRPAEGSPATMETFSATLGGRGFVHAADVYAEFRAKNPDFKIEDAAFIAWGQGLMREGHAQEAVEVLKLDASLHPESANSYNGLGVAYESAGQKDLAIEAYKKALSVNPGNANATGRLKVLQK